MATTPDPISVLQGFAAAINAKQLEAAMALVADDAVFINPGARYSGKSEIRVYVRSAINHGVTNELSNLNN